MKKLLSFICILSVILIGCTESDMLNPPADTYSVEFLGEFELTTFEGIERELPFIILVRDADNLAAGGVSVKLTLTGAEGAISPAETITDENGMVEAVMTVKASVGNTTAYIIVKAGESTQVQEVEITGRTKPATIQIHTSTPVLKVIPDQNAEIRFTAIITDENGNGVPNVDLIFSLHPVDLDSAIFGSIRSSGSTDEFGVMTVVFNTLGGSGKVIVKCEVEELIGTVYALSDSIQLTVELLSNDLQLSLAVHPAYLLLPKDTVGHATVYARVVDTNHNGIPNLRIDFSSNYVALTNIHKYTDSTGRASAEYYILPIIDFPDSTDEIVDTIRATIHGTDISKYVIITIGRTADDEGSLSLTSDVDFIYADFGRTVAHLQAVLKDESNQVMANKEIIFTSTHGTVNSPVMTDSMGVARAIFTDTGLPSTDEHGNIVPALITASYPPLSLSASIEITIEERNPVVSISLQSQEDQLTAGSSDSLWIGATCFLANGGFAPAGTEVYFICEGGYCKPNPAIIAGHNGTAVAYFYPDSTSGRRHIQAYIDNGDTLVYSNTVEVEIIPGPPASVELSYDPQYRTISATLYDRFGNRMGSGYLVTFSATHGMLSRVSASTNENGEASVTFSPGVYVGVTVITAMVGEVTAQIEIDISGNGSRSIELRADPTQIPIGGQSTLTVTAWDSNHNPYIQNGVVNLQILYEPSRLEGGCYFDNGEQLVSLEFENGEASVILHAGMIVGGKFMRLYAIFDESPQDTISLLLSRVVVVADAPRYLSVDYDRRGTDAGGGNWQLDVSARVYDQYMNPVEDSIWVEFRVDTIATIESGYTRNGSVHVPLVYHSDNTFDTVTVTARIQIDDDEYISAERELVLPLQEGILTLSVDPQNWMIDEEREAIFTCLAELRDGHDILINNAPVAFNASRGIFYWFDYRQERNDYVIYDYLDVPPEPVIKYTGWNLPVHPEHREEAGQATVYLICDWIIYFPDWVTPEVNIQIGARVVGYDDVMADPVVVVVTRHP
ncbi:Ig-like domain-containing protein [bacterium]|nr:Ig-like domain-containing protein [bacterium]